MPGFLSYWTATVAVYFVLLFDFLIFSHYFAYFFWFYHIFAGLNQSQSSMNEQDFATRRRFKKEKK